MIDFIKQINDENWATLLKGAESSHNISVKESQDAKYTIEHTENGEVISRGSIIIDMKPAGKPAGLIEDIWTKDEYRKKGLASNIVKQLVEIAKEHKCYKVVLVCSDQNVHFYNRAGFYRHQNGMRVDL